LGSTEDEVLSQVAFENISKLYKAGIILARKADPRGAKRVKEVSFILLCETYNLVSVWWF